MKIGDLAIKKLKKFIEFKGLSGKGNKKELCQTILNSLEEQVIKQIEQCWNNDLGSKELPQDPMDVNDELGKELQNFIKLHDKEKIKILESYDKLQNKKQKLKERINEQQQNFLKLPNILRFNVGPEVSISKSLLETYPNSMLYTLVSSSVWFEKFQENQNRYYLNCTEDQITKILDFVRMVDTSESQLCEEWGFLPTEYSSTICLELNNRVSQQNEDSKKDIHEFKKILEQQLLYQSALLQLNFFEYERQMDDLQESRHKLVFDKLTCFLELVYDDPIMLNVGGKLFSISKSKLQQHENTYFAPLVSGQWELQENTHFIDRSSQHFDMIYYYLTYNKIPPNLDQYFKSLDERDQKIFIKELDYYQLSKILECLPYGFSESQILNEEEAQYVQSLYPGIWRKIPNPELRDTIQKTTVVISNIKAKNCTYSGKYSKMTEDYIDFEKKMRNLKFDCLEPDRRGTTHNFCSTGVRLGVIYGLYETYEKIV